MLTEISNTMDNQLNTLSSIPLITTTTTTNNNNKRRIDSTTESDFSIQLTKRKLESSASSSSSPVGSSSPFTFQDTRFNAYNASSSPAPISSLNKSSLINLSSPQTTPATTSVIAPSSPCYSKNFSVASSTSDFFVNNNNNNNNNNNEKNQGIEIIDGTNQDSLTLRLERGTTLQFGRKAKKMTHLDSTTSVNNDNTLCILLPSSAKNASRVHCTVSLSSLSQSSFNNNKSNKKEDELKVRIKVFGQNGLKINGKLWKQNKSSGIQCFPGKRLELNFWGWSSTIIIAESEIVTPNETTIISEVEEMKSRTIFDASSSSQQQQDQEDGDLFDSNYPNPISSPLLASTSIRNNIRLPSPAFSELSDLPSSPLLSSTQLPSSSTTTTTTTSSSAASILANKLEMDLPGLIASAIVFHPRSTVGVEEVVRALLKEVGSMWNLIEGGKNDESIEKEDLAIQAWWDVIEQVLKEEDFFGCIENVGLKDAAGNQLSPAYYYLPDVDPSTSRVEALEPFVKRVRGARVAGGGKRYFWRRPSMKKNK